MDRTGVTTLHGMADAEGKKVYELVELTTLI